MIRLVSILLFLLSHRVLAAQQKWDLATCMEQAVKNNISVKRSELNTELAYVEYNSEKSKLLPTLSFLQSGGMLFGRSVDPATNLFAEKQIGYQSLGLQANLPLINYFRQRHTIKASKHRSTASKYDLESEILNLKVEVLNQFGRLVEIKKKFKVASEQITLLSKELSFLDSLLKVGKATKIAQLRLKSKLKKDSTELIVIARDFTNRKLEFLNLLGMPPNYSFEIDEDPGLVALINLPPIDLLIEKLKSASPSFLAATEEKNAIEHEIKYARLASYPLFALNFNLRTNYSSAYLNNDGKMFSYFEQINNNLSRNIFLSVSIPIFNGNIGRYNRKIAKLKLNKHFYEMTEQLQQLEAIIRTAYNNLQSAQTELNMTLTNLKTIHRSFELTSILFKEGKTSIVEYLTSFNEIESSNIRIALLEAYIFHQKAVIELYFESLGNH